MADLSNPLTQLVVGQAQPAVTANNLYDAMSPAALYGQNDLTTSGLNWGYYGGRFRGIAVAHGTIALPASQANVYIVAALATGVVSQSTSTTNWNDSTNYMRLFLATTGSSTITDWDDYREWVSSAAAGVATIDSEQIQDIVGALVQAGSGIGVSYDDASSPSTLTISNTAPTPYTSEQIEDIVGALVVAGSNVTVTYNDLLSPPTLEIASTGGGGGGGVTQENVEDIVGALVTAGSGISVTYDDASSPATLQIASTGVGGGTGADALAEGRVERAQPTKGSAGISGAQGTGMIQVTGTAEGTISAATPQQANYRLVMSTAVVSTIAGVANTVWSRRYHSTADVSNWTSQIWWGTDADHDNSSGVAVGYSDLNTHTTTPSTAYTDLICMGADGGASPDTNWQIIRRAAGAAVKVDTGIARGTNQFFKLTIKCVCGTGFTVTVEQFSTFSTGWAVVFGPTTYTTDIPASSAAYNIGEICRMKTHTATGTSSISWFYFVGTWQFPT